VNSFRDFYNKHKDKFFAYLMRRTGDYYLSGDIMQESFTRYLEKYGSNPSSPALLYTIGRNLLFDSARKQNRKNVPATDGQDSFDDMEHHLMVREEYRQVLAAMQQLESDERDILALTVSSGFSYRDIASIAGISEANVKVKIHRARIKLRKIIQAGE
jgi:RNA polymerase sigma-70 factor (ECF subfamily)